jgi:hypothetical protein
MAFKIWSKARMYLLAAVCFAVVLTPLQSAAISPALRNKDVVELFRTGISTETVVDEIRSSETNFDTSAASLKELKDANIPEPIILAMVESSARKGAPTSVASLPYDEFGHVKIYRPRRVLCVALIDSILVDNVGIVNIASGRHCSIRLRPGVHEIRTDDMSSPIYLDVQKGKEYYIRVDVAARPNLILPVVTPLNGVGWLTLVEPEQGSGEYELERPVEEDRRKVKDMLDTDSEPSLQKNESKR